MTIVNKYIMETLVTWPRHDKKDGV